MATSELTTPGRGDDDVLAEAARVNGPVGLPLDAVSPSEITISILAQMPETLHREAAP